MALNDGAPGGTGVVESTEGHGATNKDMTTNTPMGAKSGSETGMSQARASRTVFRAKALPTSKASMRPSPATALRTWAAPLWQRLWRNWGRNQLPRRRLSEQDQQLVGIDMGRGALPASPC